MQNEDLDLSSMTDKNNNTDDSSDFSQENNTISESLPLNEVSLREILMKDFGLLNDNTPTDTEASDTNQSEDQIEEDGTQDENLDTENQNGEEKVLSKETDADEEISSRGVQKRIDKLTAKRKEVEARVAELEEKLSKIEAERKDVQAPRSYKDNANPYAHLNSKAEIDAEIAQARQVRRWCEENADGIIVTDEQGNERQYTSEEIRKIKLNAMDALEEHLPKRYNYLATKEQVDVVAETEYKWYKDRSSKERQIAENFINTFPEITRFPDYKMVVGDYIRGMISRETSKSKPQTFQKAPIQPTGNASYSTSRKDVNAKSATSKFLKSGSSKDLTEVIKQFI